jgi:hypothetical protein
VHRLDVTIPVSVAGHRRRDTTGGLITADLLVRSFTDNRPHAVSVRT